MKRPANPRENGNSMKGARDMAADRKQISQTTVPRSLQFPPFPPASLDEPEGMKRRMVWLGAAFWCSLLATAIAIVWAVQNGLETSRSTRRLEKAELEAGRPADDAAKRLVVAKNELNRLTTIAADRSKAAIQSASPELDLRARVDAGLREQKELDPQLKAAQAEVQAANQAVLEASETEQRLVSDLRGNRERSRQASIYSIIAAAIGVVATAAAGWVWRRRVVA